MNVKRLNEILPQDVASRVAARWEEYRRTRGAEGTTTFFAQLHKEGVLSATQLGDVLGRLEVDVTLSAGMSSPGAPPRGAVPAPQAPARRYELVGLLGRGAMGEVHIARDVLLNRNVAMKTMDPSVAADPALAARFLVEAQVTAQLDHPSIVPVYALDIDRGKRSYAMKLIRGSTLEDYLAKTKGFADAGKVPDDEHNLDARLDLFLQVCNAIHYAHERGVLHRDLKPENVMVGAFHEVIVMDWGISKVLGQKESLSPGTMANKGTETQVGFIVGTPQYMSPEQAEGKNDELGPASDQYSLGLILFELLALRPAREGAKAVDMIYAAQENKLRPLVPYNAKFPIPRELKAIVGKATALDPARRYASVKVFADDVRRFLRDESVHAQPDSTIQRLQRWIARHRDKALAGIMALVGLVFVVGALGLAGAFGALEFSRWHSARREQALSEFLTVVQRQARRIDNEFLRYQGLLNGLTMAAEEALARPAPPSPYYLPDAFADPARAPRDLVHSTVYDALVSTEYPDVVMAPGLAEEANRPRLYQLASLRPALYRVLIESEGPEALLLDAKRRDGLIRTRGLPLIWSYVATEDGILVGYPGVGEYPRDYDPRDQAWYKEAKNTRGAAWQASADESGQGLLLTAARGVYAADAFSGVAAIDVKFDYLVEELLLPSDVDVDVDAWLVDSEGEAVVYSALKDKASAIRRYDAKPFPYPEVLEAAEGDSLRPDIELEVDGETKLFAWSKLEAVDYLYVVAVDLDDLID